MSLKIRSRNMEYSESVRDMGNRGELKLSSRHQHLSGTAKEMILSPRASRSVKQRGGLKSEKVVNQSNTDLHHEIKQGVDNRPLIPPKCSKNYQKQWSNSKATQNDELVRYMSNLPCYLQRVERGENLQEKALNFGVLDWGRLEKWKYNQKRIPSRSSVDTPSTSKASSSFSTVKSLTLSGRSHNGSIAHRRTQSSSLCFNLNSSPKDDHSQGVKSSRRNAIDLPEFRTVAKNTLVGKKNVPRIDQSSGQNDLETKLEKNKRKDSDPKVKSEMRNSSSKSKDYEVPFYPKGKMKAQDGESEKRTQKLHKLGFSRPNHHCPSRQKNSSLLSPRDCFQNSHKQFESTKSVNEIPTEANHKSFSDSLYLKEEVYLEDLYSDIPHSCPLPCRIENRQQSDMKLTGSLCAHSIQVPSDAFHSPPSSDEVPISQTEEKDAEENKSTMKLTDSIVIKPSDRLGPKTAETPAAKARNPSANHRPSISLGRLSRSFSSKDGSAMPQLRSTYVTTKSGPVKKSDASACLDNLGRDNPKANSRGRSSPLRRLLDPLLKPKAAIRPEPLQESDSMRRACKSSDGQPNSPTVRSVKKKLNLSSCSPVDANSFRPNENHETSMVQAHMRIMININGPPLFTFEFANRTDVLVAKMEKLHTSRKDDDSWIYKIYTSREIRKKSGGWMNQGRKEKGCGYAPLLVGQMKVSTSQYPTLNRHNFKNHLLVREFVLYGADEEILDLQPKNELAAIVVKVPIETLGSLRNDGKQNSNNEGLSDVGVTSLPEERCLCNSREKLQNGPTVGTQTPSSAVVVLPSGVHGLPSTGVPSPLIDRWKSGGSCDCGGWDVGCNLRILANQDQCSKNFSSSDTSPIPDRFNLFFQEGAEQNRPDFSLAPIEKGNYSVEFHGSISSLQAFSICIAVLNNRIPFDLLEVSNLFEAKTSQETMSAENDRIKAPTRVEHARIVPFPPVASVERV